VSGDPALPDPATFLSGRTGHVAGVRRTLARGAGDLLLDARLALTRAGARLDALADAAPPREVLVLGVHRPDSALIERAAAELRATLRHGVRLALGSTERLHGGKFQNINVLLEEAGGPADWTLVIDDDVQLPRRFLDRFVGACEHARLQLAQPAQTLRSHAAWPLTRRRAGSLVRETPFVEIGPVTAFAPGAATELMPFPELRFGWGLDLHWAALARERGWRLGIVDALPVRHERAPVASAYRAEDAIAEARRFLAKRPYVRADEVLRA
jgi:hypothetical protein